MSMETISLIVTIALVILIVVFIFKKAVKLAIAVGAILLIFNIGFVMNGTEIREFFNLDDWLDKDQATAVENALNDFDSKRAEYGVIDPDKVLEGMENAIAKGTAILIEGIGHIDIVAFAETVSNKLLQAGAENVDMAELEAKIKEQLSGIKDSDLGRIMDMIEENLGTGGDTTETGTESSVESEPEPEPAA